MLTRFLAILLQDMYGWFQGRTSRDAWHAQETQKQTLHATNVNKGVLEAPMLKIANPTFPFQVEMDANY